MANTVGDLVRGQQLMAVPITATVEDALRLMGDYDYSQIPVLGEDGHVVGLFTERQITTAVRMSLGGDIMQAEVRKWMDVPVTEVGANWRVTDVARMFSDTLAVIVSEQHVPLGIVTQYDIAAYLAELSKGVALAEEIEKKVREYVSGVLSSAQLQSAALHKAFGADKQDQTKPAVTFADMTLQEHIQLIITDGNWQRFEPYFRKKDEFRKVMDAARKVRNHVAHFRGKLTPSQLETLKQAVQWLDASPRVAEPATALSSSSDEDVLDLDLDLPEL